MNEILDDKLLTNFQENKKKKSLNNIFREKTKTNSDNFL